MKKLLLLVIVLLFTFQLNVYAAEKDENYYPDYDDDRYRAGTFWGSLIFGGYFPIGTPSDNLGVSSGAGFGFNFVDVLGLEVRGAYQSYSKQSNLLGYTNLIPNDGIAGLEEITKFDISAFLVFQPAFKVRSNLFIIPYVGAGADFSIIQYSFARTEPRFTYTGDYTSIGFAAKAGVRFKFNNLMIGGGIEYIMSNPSSTFNLDFSSLSYALEIGFFI